MESVLGGGLPPKHELTQLYSDTKHSYQSITEKERGLDSPEFHALHRRYRIQKNRLVTWGLEWSEGSQQTIDEAIARAGYTEMVEDVMRTIKDILTEVESLTMRARFEPTKSISPEKVDLSRSTWVASHRARYEELAKDLTNSIDILYDLSKSRKAVQQGTYPALASQDDMPARPFSFNRHLFLADDLGSTSGPPSTRGISRVSTSRTLVSGLESFKTDLASASLPPRIDHSCLSLPPEQPPPYESFVRASSRMIGHYTRPVPGSSSKVAEFNSSTIPVLIEFCNFDPIYRDTGVRLPQDRLEAFLAYFSCASASDAAASGVLTCLGYFEDPRQPRYGMVYELPKSVYGGAWDSQKSLDEFKPTSLFELIRSTARVHTSSRRVLPTLPPLEVRFKLAYNIVRAFNRLHDEELVHKDINSSNIVFFKKPVTGSQSGGDIYSNHDMRNPYLCSFDFFSDSLVEPAPAAPNQNIYRHPNDPRANQRNSKSYGLHFDLYSLGLILLEIGMWLPIAEIFKPRYSLTEFKLKIEDTFVKKLAAKCGTAYMHVVQDFLGASVKTAAGLQTSEPSRLLYERALNRLRRCCLLDEDEEIGVKDDAASISTSVSTFVDGQRGHTRPSPLNVKESPNSHVTDLRRSNSLPSSPAARFVRKQPPRWNDNPEIITEEPSEPPNVAPKDKQDSVSVLSHSSRYKRAANIIARAWLSHRIKMSNYRQKVSTMSQKIRGERRQSFLTVPNFSSDGTTEPPPPGDPDNPSQSSTSTHHDAREAGFVVTGSQDVSTETSAVFVTPAESRPRRKLRIQQTPFSHEILDLWHNDLLPSLERVVGRALRHSDETVSIDLFNVGDTPSNARPTIFVTCTSTTKVKGTINRSLDYDRNIFDLKVRKGKIRRSKVTGRATKRPAQTLQRSMEGESDDAVPLNPFYQEKPLCGSSIGAFVGHHLPPVSFGGVIIVDGKPYGMSVHHILDAPSDSDDGSDDGSDALRDSPTRSSAREGFDPEFLLRTIGSGTDLGRAIDGDWSPFELTDESSNEEDDADELDVDDDAPSEAGTDGTAGDIQGIRKGEGEDIIVTQPALTDVDVDFFPDPDDRDEDHTLSNRFGHIYATSGIRRAWVNNHLHEIDWSLIRIDGGRLQPYNLVQGGGRFRRARGHRSDPWRPNLRQPVSRNGYSAAEDEYPREIADSRWIGGSRVHCFGRTSGLKEGRINDTMGAVRIYKRRSFSRSWAVRGEFGAGGDSGAWVIQNESGRVCGHVLAWCRSTRVAYICPMDILLHDIQETLDATHICLPGGEDLASPTAWIAESRQENVRPGPRLTQTSELDDRASVEASLRGLKIAGRPSLTSASQLPPSSSSATREQQTRGPWRSVAGLRSEGFRARA